MDRFDSISPLDYRYYGDNPEFFARLQPYVSEAANVRYLLTVEVVLARMLARWGVCGPEVAEQIEASAEQVTPEEVYEEERRVRHNIRAVVNCIRTRIPPAARPYVHLFATSADVMDTAAALRYKELVRDVLLPMLIALNRTVIQISRANAGQLQIGRTHGQHAVPITFGYAMALYVSRLGSRMEAIDRAHRNLRGKFSGAVGAFNALSLFSADPAAHEKEFLTELGLSASDTSVSSQIVEPESLADLAYAVTSCFSVLADLADDLRHLIRTEIGEVVEKYEAREVGSSTMPHKMNPKNFENVKSLWKAFMPRMTTVFMDQLSEHQRDLTNSASSRFLPELFAGFCYAVERLDRALQKVEVDPERMAENVEAGKQHVVAEPLYIVLALQGFPDAYDTVMELSREARRSGARLVELANRDPRVAPYLRKLPEAHRRILDDPARYTGDAQRRTTVTCDYWEAAGDSLERRLEEERQAAATRRAHAGPLAAETARNGPRG
jgi:adenylosuccinate lyase